MNEEICQDCGHLLQEDEGVKITSEGWLCNACCGALAKGNDVY